MSIRVLCLGNDLLADDALGSLVADQLQQLGLDGVEVVSTSSTGFNLMDDVLNVSHLLVVDTVLTNAAEPGTLHLLSEKDLRVIPGGSPHYIGLFEAITLGRELGMSVPEEVLILAVEPRDCLTIGGPMHPAVQAAIPLVVDFVRRRIDQWQLNGHTNP